MMADPSHPLDTMPTPARPARGRLRWLLPAALLGFTGGALTVLALFAAGVSAADLGAWLVLLREWLEGALLAIPLPLYLLAFALLPAVGAPITLFYLTIAVLIESVPLALLAALACLAANASLSYALGARLARPLVERILARRGLRVPRVTPENERGIALTVRLSPLPYCVQSYLLSFAGVSFGRYLFWALAPHVFIGGAYILLGGSVFEGNGRYALLGLFLLVLAMTLVQLWRRQPANRAAEARLSPTDGPHP